MPWQRLALSGEEDVELYYAKLQLRVASRSLGTMLLKVVLLL